MKYGIPNNKRFIRSLPICLWTCIEKVEKFLWKRDVSSNFTISNIHLKCLAINLKNSERGTWQNVSFNSKSLSTTYLIAFFYQTKTRPLEKCVKIILTFFVWSVFYIIIIIQKNKIQKNISFIHRRWTRT